MVYVNDSTGMALQFLSRHEAGYKGRYLFNINGSILDPCSVSSTRQIIQNLQRYVILRRLYTKNKIP